MTRAQHAGHVRLPLDEGAPVLALLRALAARADAPARTRRTLAAARPPAPTGAPPQSLVDPLGAGEIEVLGLLASDLDGPATARTPVVGVTSVRTHTTSIDHRARRQQPPRGRPPRPRAPAADRGGRRRSRGTTQRPARGVRSG